MKNTGRYLSDHNNLITEPCPVQNYCDSKSFRIEYEVWHVAERDQDTIGQDATFMLEYVMLEPCSKHNKYILN